jgi:hypothetical protein
VKNGDIVQIYPFLEDRSVAVDARIELLSSNGRSIAVRLADRPSWFQFGKGVYLHREHGDIVMLLSRDRADVGPWVDISTQLQYRIEERLVN